MKKIPEEVVVLGGEGEKRDDKQLENPDSSQRIIQSSPIPQSTPVSGEASTNSKHELVLHAGGFRRRGRLRCSYLAFALLRNFWYKIPLRIGPRGGIILSSCLSQLLLVKRPVISRSSHISPASFLSPMYEAVIIPYA